MVTAQLNAIQRPTIYYGSFPQSRRPVLKPSTFSFHGVQMPLPSLKLSSSAASRVLNSMPLLMSHRSGPVCLSKNEGDNKGSPFKAFENVMGNFTKGDSIEDVLRQQIKKGEFIEDRDGGGNSPRGDGGGGGGGRGGPGDSGGSDDEGFSGILDETLQVVLATLGFIFLYIYIISGEELIKLVKDYLKYIFRGTESVRLKRVMMKWRRFFMKLTEKKEYDKYWLEREIINTPTWWDSPEKYRRIFGSGEESKPSRSYGESASYGSYGDGEATSYGSYEESYREDDF